MEKILLHFEIESGKNADEIIEIFSKQVNRMQEVESVNVDTDTTRLGLAETVAAIAAFIVISKKLREGIDELTELIKSLRKLVEEVDGLWNAYLDIGGEKISLSDTKAIKVALTKEMEDAL